jgi:4,5:9,10-diseco-3-hydroxy-5,9,17-trioxoandrosta-1(10),2-diene-4-oate hydrolase
MSSEARHHDVTVEGLRIHYVVAGQGPPVVLVHGLGVSLATWGENLGPLSQRYTVYALDIPGHGDSDKTPPGGYTLEAGVRWFVGFLDALSLSQAALVGNSLGGLLALKTALDRPERVTRLVLVDAAGLGREVAIFLRLASLPLMGTLLEQPVFGGVRDLLRRIVYNGRAISPELVRELERVRSSPGARQAELHIVRHGVNLRGVRRHAQLLQRLPELRPPVLLVWGLQDPIFPVNHAYAAFRALPRARLVVYPECGHWPQIERAEEFNRVVAEFLAGG